MTVTSVVMQYISDLRIDAFYVGYYAYLWITICGNPMYNSYILFCHQDDPTAEQGEWVRLKAQSQLEVEV